MSEELKPCPFCGSMPDVIDDWVAPEHKDGCPLENMEFYIHEWNTRHNEQEPLADRLLREYVAYLNPNHPCCPTTAAFENVLMFLGFDRNELSDIKEHWLKKKKDNRNDTTTN